MQMLNDKPTEFVLVGAATSGKDSVFAKLEAKVNKMRGWTNTRD